MFAGYCEDRFKCLNYKHEPRKLRRTKNKTIERMQNNEEKNKIKKNRNALPSRSQVQTSEVESCFL